MSEGKKDTDVLDGLSQDPGADGPVTKPKKRSKRKVWTVVGVVAAVVVVLVIGFNVWHQQPSFCNAICHTPMDVYVEAVTDGTHDKYGNELTPDEDQAMMGYLHYQNGYTDCLGCHVPTISEQVSEASEWVTGDYTVIGPTKSGEYMIQARTLDELAEARGLDNSSDFCLASGCHVTDDGAEVTADNLEDVTAGLSETRNPHNNYHNNTTCSDCHKAHAQSVNQCSECHADAPIPDGWLTADEAKDKLTALSK